MNPRNEKERHHLKMKNWKMNDQLKQQESQSEDKEHLIKIDHDDDDVNVYGYMKKICKDVFCK